MRLYNSKIASHAKNDTNEQKIIEFFLINFYVSILSVFFFEIWSEHSALLA